MTASYFTDAERKAIIARLRLWTDTLHKPVKIAYIWSIADYHVFGAVEEPPKMPRFAWVDRVHARFEREVLRATGHTIHLPRLFEVSQ